MTHTVGRNGERERERKREQDKDRKRGLRQGSHEGLGDGVRLYGLNRKGLIYLSSPESAHVSLPHSPSISLSPLLKSFSHYFPNLSMSRCLNAPSISN
jgi:hypothetical protein